MANKIMETLTIDGVTYEIVDKKMRESIVELTQDEYNALGDVVKTDGKIYYITDAGGVYSGGSSSVDLTDYAKIVDLDKFGGTVEITSGNPTKEKTVLTFDPLAEEINIYTSEEIDKMFSNFSGDENTSNNLALHINNKDNPHDITASQIGLDKVDNTSDLEKPVSLQTQTAISQCLSDAKSDTSNSINNHNSSTLSHHDMREQIKELSDRLSALVDSDDATLSQLSEIVTYIESNKSLIDAITIAKVNVDDIADDLDTNMAQRPLSARQGVVIKELINALQTNVDTKANSNDLTSHTSNKENPHGVTASQIDVYTKSEVNAALNKKADDYSLEIYNGTSGNPKPVKFMTVNYSTCGSENGVAIKLGLVSGHGNGSSYAFLEDAIIKVTYTGLVSVDNFKYYGADTGSYEGVNRQYGDIFWVINTDDKVVDFYVLMGQYARVNMTPYKRVTYSTGGTITQYTSCTIYSSGTKNWANNSKIALMSDIQSNTETWTFVLEDGTQVTKAVYIG